MTERMMKLEEGYETLFEALMGAYEQAAHGKGADRHGSVGEDFRDQPIFWIAEEAGEGFLLGQAMKKIVESKRMAGRFTDPDRYRRAVEELRGAVVYLCAQIIRLEREGRR